MCAQHPFPERRSRACPPKAVLVSFGLDRSGGSASYRAEPSARWRGWLTQRPGRHWYRHRPT